MKSFIQDARYAVRLLWKNPIFAVTAVFSLGLGIGANTVLFSIFNSLLWKPLPVPDPQSIVRIYAKASVQSYMYQNFSYPEYLDYCSRNEVLTGIAASTGAELGFGRSGAHAARVFGEAVSDNYFEVFGILPRFGRIPASRRGFTNAVPEVVLGHRFWTRRLNADPAVVGQTIWLSGVPFTITGVMPAAFKGASGVSVFAPDLWLPLGMMPQLNAGNQELLQNRGKRSLQLVGRLKPGVSIPQAQAALRVTGANLERSWPDFNKGVTPLVFREIDTRPEVYNSRAVNLAAAIFMVFAALVMLVACANVANLMLARSSARQREIALRLAIGAGRSRLVRQLLTESLVLALSAGTVGLLTGCGASRAVSSISLPGDMPIAFEVATDLRVALYTFAMSMLAAAGFGLIPALKASRPDLVTMLKSLPGSSGGRRRGFTTANALLVTQVAVSLVLLVAAGLFWRSIAGTKVIDPGMEIPQRTLVSFNPSLLRYDAIRTTTFYKALLDRVSRLPGAEYAALASWVPLGFQMEETTLVIHGDAARSGGDKMRSLVNIVTSGYFGALGVKVTQGRPITDLDTGSTHPVAMVNETLARLAWPGQNPLGRQLRSDVDGAPWLTVVGVVADGKYRNLTESPSPYVLRPLAQLPRNGMTLVVKSGADHASILAALRREVEALDPLMPLLDVKTMEQQMFKPLFVPRALAALAGTAALLALAIASVGLYGVMGCSVSRRTREIGIRLAIGASPYRVAGDVMTQGLTIVGIGMAVGGLAALTVGRVLRRMLVGVGPTDPLTFGCAFILLVGVAFAASYFPALRASRVDPVAALRHD
jgi:predicted permease